MWNPFRNQNLATDAETIESLKKNVKQLQDMLEESFVAQDDAYIAGFENGKVNGAMAVITSMEKKRREDERDEKAMKKLFGKDL